jgi:hypothetical protein
MAKAPHSLCGPKKTFLMQIMQRKRTNWEKEMSSGATAQTEAMAMGAAYSEKKLAAKHTKKKTEIK